MKQRVPIDQQLDVMNLLWDRGSATVAEIHATLGEEVALPAARTVVHGLEEEGYLRAEPKEGAVRYYPTVSREDVGRRATRRVLEGFFEGSVPDFLEAMARAADWPEEKTDAMRSRLPADSESWLPPRSK